MKKLIELFARMRQYFWPKPLLSQEKFVIVNPDGTETSRTARLLGEK